MFWGKSEVNESVVGVRPAPGVSDRASRNRRNADNRTQMRHRIKRSIINNTLTTP